MSLLNLPSATSTRQIRARDIPSEHKTLVFHTNTQPLQLTTKPVPEVKSGSAIVRILASNLLSYTQDLFNGKRNYPYPAPYTPGCASVGRIVAIGDDATTLVPGDLVLVEVFLHGRDDPDAMCMQGLYQGDTAETARLVESEYKEGTYAGYTRVPLENCIRLQDDGRDIKEWCNLSRMLISFGGLTDNGGLDVKPGESIVIAPATGQFTGSAVEVALAMGARVVALGRNPEALQKLQTGLSEYGSRLKTVRMTGDIEADTKAIGPVDCYLDASPPEAGKSSHITSCFNALKPRGQMCIWGSMQVLLEDSKILRQNITIRGKWMYERDAPRQLLKMVDAGLLKLDRCTTKSFDLEQWEEAFEHAKVNMRWGQLTALVPGGS